MELGRAACTDALELRYVRDLACKILRLKVVPQNLAGVPANYNVLLASLCDPHLVHDRIGLNYRPESDILDIAQRIRVGADIALAVAESSVVFNTTWNQARMCMSIRAIASVGLGDQPPNPLNIESNFSVLLPELGPARRSRMERALQR